MSNSKEQDMTCTKQSDCKAGSHYGDCLSMSTGDPTVERFKVGDIVALKCDEDDQPMLFRVRQVGERISCRPLRTRTRGGYLFRRGDVRAYHAELKGDAK